MGHEARRRTGCAALPKVMEYAGKYMEKELASRTKEFYEFMLPPTDIQDMDGTIVVSVDVPGYSNDEIKMRLDGSMLTVTACRKPPENVIYAQRPNSIRKNIRIPARIRRGEEPECSASLQDGVLQITIPIPQSGKDITIG